MTTNEMLEDMEKNLSIKTQVLDNVSTRVIRIVYALYLRVLGSVKG